MNANPCGDFKWDDLLYRINRNKVIPVIGEGLYWVNTPDAENVLLYPYLAEKLVQEMGLAPLKPNETFYQTVFRYLEQKNSDYRDVNEFLSYHLETISLVPEGPLWQLARIKAFSLFINATYDNYLEQTLKNVRSHTVDTIHYTVHDKWSRPPDPSIAKMLSERQRSFIFNVYGSANHNLFPAYTEKDILETIVTFQKDMETERINPFFQTLERSSLLFMGCGYEDWLFRFFIRTISNKPYDRKREQDHLQFIGDASQVLNCGGLVSFLKAYAAEVYYSSGNREFVNRLFQEIEEKHPMDIIQEDDFPGPAFISFNGIDRNAAECLAARLLEDGIKVWYDQWDLSPGDEVDVKIAKAISARAVFIPIVSNAAKQFRPHNGKIVKYHIREWEWAYNRSISGENPVRIIPVIIDDTDWMYDSFRKYSYLKIPGGERTGQYEKLRARLREILDIPGQVKQS